MITTKTGPFRLISNEEGRGLFMVTLWRRSGFGQVRYVTVSTWDDLAKADLVSKDGSKNSFFFSATPWFSLSIMDIRERNMF